MSHRELRGHCLGTLMLGLALAVGSRLPAADDLTPELKKELAKIQANLKTLESRLDFLDRDAVDRGLREAQQWIKEFAIDAELPDDDAIIAALKKQMAAISEKATAAAKKRDDEAAKMKAAKKPPEPQKDLTREIRSLVKVAVDLSNVSFKRDVAPIVANVCSGCHNAQRKQGNFDASTYESFMTQIEAGTPEDSHALLLVTGRAQPRMPRGGQARFEREWAETWTAWIKQGAKFDGTSKTARMTEYMIDLETQRREAIGKLSTADVESLHRLHAERQIKLVQPVKKIQSYNSLHFLVQTTLSFSDAEYIGVLAETVLEELMDRLGQKGKPIWRGKFGVNVFADRVDYLAFAKNVDRYDPDPQEFGHIRLNPEHQYLAMVSHHGSGSLDALATQQIAMAFLRQLGDGKLPAWAVYGYGSVVASRQAPKDPFLRQDLQRAAVLVASGRTLQALATENVPWMDLGPLGAGFFQYLEDADRRGSVQFLKSLAKTGNLQQSLVALGASPQALSQGWAAASARAARR